MHKITETFGLALTLADLYEEGGEAWSKELRRLLYTHKVLVLKGFPLEEESYLEFCRQIGTPVKFVDKNYYHPDHSEIFVVSNMVRDGKPFGMKRVGYYWHSDCSFLEEPLPITSLHCHKTPEFGGETGFVDMVAVWKYLPRHLKSMLVGKTILHDSSLRYIVVDDDIGLSLRELIERDLLECPPVVHPAIVPHAKMDEEVLYVNEGFSSRILGVPREESDKVLREVFNFIDTSPYKYLHKWTVGDIVLWDNRSVQHRAFPYAEGERLMFRVGLRDEAFFGGRNGI